MADYKKAFYEKITVKQKYPQHQARFFENLEDLLFLLDFLFCFFVLRQWMISSLWKMIARLSSKKLEVTYFGPGTKWLIGWWLLLFLLWDVPVCVYVVVILFSNTKTLKSTKQQSKLNLVVLLVSYLLFLFLVFQNFLSLVLFEVFFSSCCEPMFFLRFWIMEICRLERLLATLLLFVFRRNCLVSLHNKPFQQETRWIWKCNLIVKIFNMNLEFFKLDNVL